MRIFVGNMSFGTDENMLRDLFGRHGEVEEVTIVTDRETGRPRGFAFVTMSDEAAGQAAIDALNGQQLDGRALTVNQARPRAAGGGDRGGPGRGPRGGSRYGGGGGGGGGYGDRTYGGGGGRDSAGRSGYGGGRGGSDRDRW